MRNILILILFFTFFATNIVNAQDANQLDKGVELKIYPNPLMSGQKLNIEAEKVIVSVEVLDIIGKTIKYVENSGSDSKEISCVLDQYKQGLYIVKTTYKDKLFSINKLLVKSQ